MYIRNFDLELAFFRYKRRSVTVLTPNVKYFNYSVRARNSYDFELKGPRIFKYERPPPSDENRERYFRDVSTKSFKNKFNYVRRLRRPRRV